MIQRKLMMVRVNRTAQEQLYNQIISMYNVSTCAFGCRQIHRHAGFYRIDIRLTLIPRQGPPRRLRGITGGQRTRLHNTVLTHLRVFRCMQCDNVIVYEVA